MTIGTLTPLSSSALLRRSRLFEIVITSPFTGLVLVLQATRSKVLTEHSRYLKETQRINAAKSLSQKLWCAWSTRPRPELPYGYAHLETMLR